MLYTTHTGDQIPQVVEKAFDVIVEKYKSLLSLKEFKTDASILELIELNLMTERLQYPNTAASLIVAARPCFLEFVTPLSCGWVEDRECMKYPYWLRILDDRWVLGHAKGQPERLASFNLTEELFKRLLLQRNLLIRAQALTEGDNEE